MVTLVVFVTFFAFILRTHLSFITPILSKAYHKNDHISGRHSYMSQLDDQMAGSVLMSDEKVSNPVQLHQIRGEQDVIEASELCIDVFFGNEGNFFKGMMLKKLRRQQVFDLLQRLWHRVDDFMIKAVGINGNMLGIYIFIYIYVYIYIHI
jgi:hypothetical protein